MGKRLVASNRTVGKSAVTSNQAITISSSLVMKLGVQGHKAMLKENRALT
jgi:hypothetical protein